MTGSFILACLWVLAASAVSLLPRRRQYLPGIVLLVSAVFILSWLASQLGPWVMLVGLAAVLSMFRKPLIYLSRRALGLSVTLPRDIEEREP